MSNKALDWAWRQNSLNPVEKLVLVALADRADKITLQCNPGLKHLEDITCASKRGIRNAIVVLEGRGLVRRDFKTGIGTTYTLVGMAPTATGSVAPNATPAPNGGVAVDATPAPEVWHSLPRGVALTATKPLENPESITSSLSPVGVAQPPPLRAVAPTHKGRRLPSDWQPSDDLLEFAARLGLDPKAVADRFRDHWHGATGARARKADWDATWRNWCRKDAEDRAQRSRAWQPLTPERFGESVLRAAGAWEEDEQLATFYSQPPLAGALQ